MGLTEWRDLEAAARYALAHGARRLVLVGYSMGGSLVAQFMEKSRLADRVDALVLDAPALNWKRILEFNATEMGLPGLLALPVEWAVGARIDADWDSLDALQHTEDFHLPILLFHGTDDDVIPIETSDDFAARAARTGSRYYRVPEAGPHPELERRPRASTKSGSAASSKKPCKRRLNENEPDRSRARAVNEEPAATYSPRGLPPKYHRRRVA